MSFVSRRRKPLAPDANVVKEGWWLATCSKHGSQAHLSLLGGRCCVCQDEDLVAKGLLATDQQLARRR